MSEMQKQKQKQQSPVKVEVAPDITMGVYDVTSGKYKQMTYLESFNDLIANHDGVSMGFPKDIYDRDKDAITKASKVCNYGAEYKGQDGKIKPMGGMYCFKFYGAK